eukprot:CAMPEP_0204339818 /NCGR_PEP_ID=MMETSP0469-20131031/22091_1 /ASSEMBLY_ACC=CAM_ASM_000384 /TAXON_ID=2969 /ORGANISM="Oxyrrhis marina" /LENGTH=88 /DNA_ID=CAMNT_0051324211 /DNA_START=384 /DNA_END=649 /DNA_ORIENTATION=-
MGQPSNLDQGPDQARRNIYLWGMMAPQQRIVRNIGPATCRIRLQPAACASENMEKAGSQEYNSVSFHILPSATLSTSVDASQSLEYAK